MTIENVLSQHDKVRKTGANTYVACCRAHPDKSPSLAITEESDGKVLVYCYAGCSFDEIRSAAGLAIGEFFPPDLSRVGRQRQRSSFNARDALKALAFEVTTVRMIALMMKREGRLSEGSQERLGVAMVRLLGAEELINGC